MGSKSTKKGRGSEPGLFPRPFVVDDTAFTHRFECQDSCDDVCEEIAMLTGVALAYADEANKFEEGSRPREALCARANEYISSAEDLSDYALFFEPVQGNA